MNFEYCSGMFSILRPWLDYFNSTDENVASIRLFLSTDILDSYNGYRK